MIIIGCGLIALAVFFGLRAASAKNAEFLMKPRVAFAQAVVAGQTEQSEQVQFTATLFVDETPEEWAAKLAKLYALREARLHEQNVRMIKLQEESIKKGKEALEEAERLNIPTNVTPLSQSK